MQFPKEEKHPKFLRISEALLNINHISYITPIERPPGERWEYKIWLSNGKEVTIFHEDKNELSVNRERIIRLIESD